jgi:pSer/pThr/pTyr-binding forkhead associated (FHA) protein
MKLKLIVLAGAKEGLEIPLRKDKFLIGRAKECALRAGSEAISRRHCAIIRRETGYAVRDLGSRNGTLVNGEKITAEVPLKPGDELRVGPLHFRVAERESSAVASAPAADPAAAATTKPKRQPPVKDVADVVERTISNSDSTSEDDVSRWLLGGPEDVGDTLKETRSMRAEDTSTTINKLSMGDTATIEDVSQLVDEEVTGEAAAPANGEKADEGGSGVWKFFKRGGKGPAPKKKEPGKLPPRAAQQTKDSREAAADILRDMQRRR